jgi:hypothetical protein
MRHFWSLSDNKLLLEASRAVLGSAAARVQPSKDLQDDAPELIASMFAAGLDSAAARWANTVRQMDDDQADRVWAMLAVGAPDSARIDVSTARINDFIDRDKSQGKQRSALLVAALVGLGRIDAGNASRLSSRYRLHIGRASRWTQMLDAAARRNQSGTVLVLAGTGLQGADFDAVPPGHLFHIVMALRNTRQELAARMIAAEALART